MRVGLDIDGVILDFERVMRTYAEMYDLLILNKCDVINDNEFDYLKRYVWSEKEKKAFIDDYLVYATLHSTPLMPLIKVFLRFLKLEGIEYEIISERGLLNAKMKDAVIEVLMRYGIPTRDIHFEVSNKVSECKKLGITLMIEDNPNIVSELIDNGIDTVYFKDKNSIGLNNSELIHEVSNVGEIVRYIVSINGLNRRASDYEKILRPL